LSNYYIFLLMRRYVTNSDVSYVAPILQLQIKVTVMYNSMA